VVGAQLRQCLCMVHCSLVAQAPYELGYEARCIGRYWDFDGNKMWFDADQPIRFRVQSVKLHPVPTRADMQVITTPAV
jgi:hypothetical protein